MFHQRRWSSFTLGALVIVGCAVALLFSASSSSAIPMQQTAFVNPFFTPPPETCPTTADFQKDDIVVLTGGVLIRYGPNPSAPFIVTFPENRLFTVLEGGPLCVEGINWYPITGHGVTGWASEGTRDGSRYWMVLEHRAGDPEFPCVTPLNLTEGNRFEVNRNVRLRQQPSTEATTITVVPYTATIVVLGGPVCADGYNWWRVRTVVVDVTYEGWVAEGVRAPVTGAPFISVTQAAPCHAPLALVIGGQARVIYNDTQPKRLRTAPGLHGDIITELIEHVPLLVLGGPVCADGYNWWNVRVLSSTPFEGWLAEGGPANWWIAPISEFRF